MKNDDCLGGFLVFPMRIIRIRNKWFCQWPLIWRRSRMLVYIRVLNMISWKQPMNFYHQSHSLIVQSIRIEWYCMRLFSKVSFRFHLYCKHSSFREIRSIIPLFTGRFIYAKYLRQNRSFVIHTGTSQSNVKRLLSVRNIKTFEYQ